MHHPHDQFFFETQIGKIDLEDSVEEFIQRFVLVVNRYDDGQDSV